MNYCVHNTNINFNSSYFQLRKSDQKKKHESSLPLHKTISICQILNNYISFTRETWYIHDINKNVINNFE